MLLLKTLICRAANFRHDWTRGCIGPLSTESVPASWAGLRGLASSSTSFSLAVPDLQKVHPFLPIGSSRGPRVTLASLGLCARPQGHQCSEDVEHTVR